MDGEVLSVLITSLPVRFRDASILLLIIYGLSYLVDFATGWLLSVNNGTSYLADLDFYAGQTLEIFELFALYAAGFILGVVAVSRLPLRRFGGPALNVPEIPLPVSLLTILIMCAVSIFMMIQGVGITTVMGGKGLPFQLAGLLFYTRLLIFPLILCVLATKSPPRYWMITGAAIAFEAVLAAVASGSRLVGLLHVLPLLYIPARRVIVYPLAFLVAILNIDLATRARSLIFPQLTQNYFVVDSSAMQAFKQTYGSPSEVALASDLTSPLSQLWIAISGRALGLSELNLAMKGTQNLTPFHEQFTNFASSLNLPISRSSLCATHFEIFGLPPDYYGGVGFDPVGSALVASCGNFGLTGLYGLLTGLMLGTAVFVASILQRQISARGISQIIVIICLIMLYSDRWNVVTGYLVTLICVSGLLNLVTRTKLGSQPLSERIRRI